MVDNFAIALSHGLMAIALWRMLYRDDLDHEVGARRVWQQDQLDKASAQASAQMSAQARRDAANGSGRHA